MSWILKIVIFFLSYCGLTYATTRDIELPDLNAQVIDQAKFLNQHEISELSSLIEHLYKKGGPQVAILTVENLQGYTIEDFSIKVAERWQLGSKERDQGLLIVVAKEERSMRVEVGNGIEGEITDYISSYYVKELMPKYFRQGFFFDGFKEVLLDIADKFAISIDQPTEFIKRKNVKTVNNSYQPLLKLYAGLVCIVLGFASSLFPRRPIARAIFSGIFITFICLPVLLSVIWYVVIFIFSSLAGALNLGFVLNSIMSHRTGFGGGGFGSSGGWGGGGGFSGGGSSGRW